MSGTLKGTTAKIHVDPTATPTFHKARPDWARYGNAWKGQLNQSSTLSEPHPLSLYSNRMVQWEFAVNKVFKLEAYPIPKLDDLYTKLAGGQIFTELGLSHAYEQMLIDEVSKEFLTINTHKGL